MVHACESLRVLFLSI